MNAASFGRIPSENHPLFPVQEPGENMQNKEDLHENRTYQKTKGY